MIKNERSAGKTDLENKLHKNRFSNTTIEQMRKHSRFWAKEIFFSTLFFSLLILSSCRNEDIPAPSDFTKEKREQLGDLIKITIAADPTNFPVLPQTAPYDSTYWYIQKLYDQASNVYRVDGKSPSNDRWDKTRNWQVTILDLEDEKTAFIAPGGHLYISTGLLQSLEAEYELFYILTFEATLMHERYVFNRLINEYNTTTLNNFVMGIPSDPGMPTLEDVAMMIGEIDFDEEMTKEVDHKSVSLICQSSIFDRTGIISIADRLDPDETKWMQTRKTYDYRDQTDYILNLPLESGDNCGDFQTNGGYHRFVLNRL